MSSRNLTFERLKEVLDYDQLTGVFTWKVTRGTIKKGQLANGKDRRGYVIISIDGSKYKAHRLAWLYINGVWPESGLDHINRVKDDNRLVNLREAEQSLNNKNASVRHNHPTGISGVKKSRNSDSWKASIKVDGVRINLGRFSDLFEAICARKSAEIKYGFYIPVKASPEGGAYAF